MASSIVLINPKSIRNLASVIRAAACFGISEVRYTGMRAEIDSANYSRLPRELRMKDYQCVNLQRDDMPLLRLTGIPVAIEFDTHYVPLPLFHHPTDAIYVFGPEDGNLSRSILCQCHQFVTIPTQHCLNLAMAVNIVLYDRASRKIQSGG